MDIFGLDKELAQSKININLNEINKKENKNKFLSSRKWDYFDGNKIVEIDDKVESIYKKLNKERINIIISQCEQIKLEKVVNLYNPLIDELTIGLLSSLNFMVESTFYNGHIKKDTKFNDLNELTPYMFKFRSILGDGDCFYRGLIFSILENIILTNNIMQMKELLILYYEKINKNNKLITKKDYLKTINQMDIDIVPEILYIIINKMETDISKAYSILLKVFLSCNEFDFAIIYFTRYLIYEYISANESKIYSKEYQVEVGCLLPDDYIIDQGAKNDYLFENYYAMNLMNPKNCAEKIVLYVTPFVFNINMNILIYDFGEGGEKSIIQEKKFMNENGNKNNLQAEINLLFRKSHYDTYYKLDYYEDYQKYFDIFINKNEDNFQKPKIENSNPFGNYNNILDKGSPFNNNNTFNENKDPFNENNNNSFHEDNNNHFNENDNDSFNENDILDDNNFIFDDNKVNIDDYLQCIGCQNFYKKNENKFNHCDKCLFYNLRSSILSLFLSFVKDKTNMINSQEKLKNLLSQEKCKIPNSENISIQEAIDSTKFKLNDILLSIKKNLCLFCCTIKIEKNDFFIQLPCKCKICSEDCFIRYVKYIESNFSLVNNPLYFKHLNLFSCFCGFVYNTKNLLYLIKETEKRKLHEQNEVFKKYLSNLMKWRCFICKNNFESKKEFIKADFDRQNVDKNLLNEKKEFKHLLCNVCLIKYDVFPGRNIFCNICESQHKIINLIKVNFYNEETNPINF